MPPAATSSLALGKMSDGMRTRPLLRQVGPDQSRGKLGLLVWAREARRPKTQSRPLGFIS